MKSCPECESANIHKSRRRGIVERIILASIFVRPFRCEKCDSRFYRWSFSADPQASRQATTR
jgi:transposase-like protein